MDLVEAEEGATGTEAEAGIHLSEIVNGTCSTHEAARGKVGETVTLIMAVHHQVRQIALQDLIVATSTVVENAKSEAVSHEIMTYGKEISRLPERQLPVLLLLQHLRPCPSTIGQEN